MSGDKDALIYLADVRIDELEAENAKLRELVKSIHRYVHECQLGCEQYLDGNERCDESRDACWMVRKMRELGVEVDA